MDLNIKYWLMYFCFKNLDKCIWINLQALHSSGCLNGNARPLSIAAILIETCVWFCDGDDEGFGELSLSLAINDDPGDCSLDFVSDTVESFLDDDYKNKILF